MNILLIALIPPFLFAITNFLDKFIITKYFKDGGIGTLMLFSSVIALIALPIIYCIHPDIVNITTLEKTVIGLSGMFTILGVLLYLYALDKEDVSSVVPLFQLIPVFTLILGAVFLHEILTSVQICGGFLIIFGSIFLTKKQGEKIRFQNKIFWLMFFASLLMSVSAILFKSIAIETDYWTTVFWSYIGVLLLCLIFFIFLPNWRREFLQSIRKNGLGIVSLNILNEIINAAGGFTLAYATLLAPIAVIYFVNGIQSLFTLVIGIGLTILFPKIFQENIEKKNVGYKLVWILVILAGLTLVY